MHATLLGNRRTARAAGVKGAGEHGGPGRGLVDSGRAWPGFGRRAQPSISHHAPLLWRAPAGPADKTTAPAGGARAKPPEKSHVIRLPELSTKPQNVAIPTITIQIMK